MGEHEVQVVPFVAGVFAFDVLREPVIPEEFDDGFGEGDGSPPGPGFGFDEDESFASLASQCPPHGERRCVQFDAA